MIRFFLNILLGLISFNSIGQSTNDHISLIVNHTVKGHSNIVNAEMAMDSTQNTLVLFLQSKTKSFVHVFSKNEVYESSGFFEFYNDELNTVYSNYSLIKGSDLLFLSSIDGKVSLNKLNLKTGDLNSDLLKSKYKKLRIIGTRFYKDKIYLFCTTKNNSQIKLLIYSEFALINEYSYSYSETDFIKPKWFYNSIFNRNGVLSNQEELQFLENTPNNKQYNNPNSVIFSLNRDSITYSMEFNLDDLTEMLTYTNPLNKSGKDLKQMNSYIYGDHLFQVAISDEEYWVEIKEIKTNTLLNEFSIIKNDSLYFIHSNILQEGGKFSRYYNPIKLSKPKTVLKTLKKNYLSLSVKENALGYNLILGSIHFMYDDLAYIKYSPLKTDQSNSTVLPKYFPYTYRSTKFALQLTKEMKLKSDSIDLRKMFFQYDYEKLIEGETGKLVYQFMDKVFYGYYNYKDKKYVLKGVNKEVF